MSGITYFGQTDFRNEQKKFGIKDKDRLRHIYIIGKTGVGKSTMIENMIAQDIINGNGCAFLDPHGASAEKMLDYIPPERVDDVVYFAPFDMAHPISFNVMEDVGPDKRHHVANGILSVMKKIWVDAFSGRMEYIVQNVLLALMETPGSTLLGINRMLADKEYRQMIIDNIKDPSVKSFWVDEYLKWDERYQREAGAAIQNKIGQFTSNPLIRNIVGQPKSSFDIRELMDNKKILIANFSKGLLGEQNARLLGSMLSTSIYLAAMSRAELDEEEMKNVPPFYLYVDEFQNFANDSFADVLSEARKYKLSLTMAHQYIAQMPDTVREAIFGNVGTMITFRVGPEDAEAFEREFSPTFVAADFTNLGPFQIYLRLMIDGLNSSPFSARTLPPIPTPDISMKLQSFQRSRQLYANNREAVQKAIEDWFAPIPSKKQLDHQEYLAKKKAEIEAKGGVWIDPSGAVEDTPSPIKDYTPSKKDEGVYRKPYTASAVVDKKSIPSPRQDIHEQRVPSKPRLGVEPKMMAQATYEQKKTNAESLDSLLPPSQIKKIAYEQKKKIQESMVQASANTPVTPEVSPLSFSEIDDETVSPVVLSSQLKDLLDTLNEDAFEMPIHVQSSIPSPVSNPSITAAYQPTPSSDPKVIKNTHTNRQQNPSPKKPTGSYIQKSSIQQIVRNTPKKPHTHQMVQTTSGASAHSQQSITPSSAFQHTSTQNRQQVSGDKKQSHIQQAHHTKASHQSRPATTKAVPVSHARESSQDTKKKLQEVLARALKDKQNTHQQNEAKKIADKQAIPDMVSRAHQAPHHSTHSTDTLADTIVSSYTTRGVAPDTSTVPLKNTHRDAPSEGNRKEEAPVDILRDILGV